MRATWLESEPPIALPDLLAQGVLYEQWPTQDGAYQPAVDALMQTRGYVEQDIIDLSEGPQAWTRFVSASSTSTCTATTSKSSASACLSWASV